MKREKSKKVVKKAVKKVETAKATAEKPEVVAAKAPETLDEAIEQVKSNSKSKFAGSADMHITTKSKEKDYSLRGTVTFPNAFGAEKRVLVFCEDKDKEKAIAAGADFAGLDDLIKKINEGWLEFDMVLATPTAMAKIAILGKALGPKGLMPNPKSGTVVTDFSVIKGFKGGKTTFKGDPTGVVHCSFGKVDMETKALVENAKALADSVREACNKSKASINAIILAPTMGKSVHLAKELI